jgi:phage host-nuclease inhibitor protein Gam
MSWDQLEDQQGDWQPQWEANLANDACPPEIVEDAIARRVELQAAKDELEERVKAEVARIRERHENKLDAWGLEIDQINAGLKAMMGARGVKTATYAQGTVTVAYTAPKLEMVDEDETLQALKDSGLNRFIKVKESVDKPALKRELRQVMHGYVLVDDGGERLLHFGEDELTLERGQTVRIAI